MPYDETHGGRRSPRQHHFDRAEERGFEDGEARGHEVFAMLDAAAVEALAEALAEGSRGADAVDEIVQEPDWLSGEWAGESITELIGDLLDDARTEYGEEMDGEMLDAYEEGAHDGFWSAIYEGIEEEGDE